MKTRGDLVIRLGSGESDNVSIGLTECGRTSHRRAFILSAVLRTVHTLLFELESEARGDAQLLRCSILAYN